MISPYLSGNKYRKFYSLLQTPKEKYHTVISYGGTQSNAMLSISAICQTNNWKFIYYTKTLSTFQKINPSGNFKQALSLGMQHKEIYHANYKEFVSTLSLSFDENILIINQGGASRSSMLGLEVLAKEIQSQDIKTNSIATPSGTGTTSLFLAKYLKDYTVYTTPCVGDAKYLREQMSSIGDIPSNLIILRAEKKYHFAKLYKEHIDIYKKALYAGVEFDLLYAPRMLIELLSQTQEKILYIHSGGVGSNASMLERYKNSKIEVD